ACATCGDITIQVGEFNGGPASGPTSIENMGFPGAIFLAAGEIQFLNVGVSPVQVFKLQGGSNPCNDCLMNSSAQDAIDPQGEFLEQFPPLLGGGTVTNTAVVSSVSNLWATTVSRPGVTSLLFVNANLTNPSVNLDLSPSFTAGQTATVRMWTGPTGVTTQREVLSTSLSIPSLSIVLIQVGAAPGNSSGGGHASSTAGFGIPSSFGV